jgi:hypothetical protein
VTSGGGVGVGDPGVGVVSCGAGVGEAGGGDGVGADAGGDVSTRVEETGGLGASTRGVAGPASWGARHPAPRSAVSRRKGIAARTKIQGPTQDAPSPGFRLPETKNQRACARTRVARQAGDARRPRALVLGGSTFDHSYGGGGQGSPQQPFTQ